MAAVRSTLPASVYPQTCPPDSLADDRSRIFGATLARLDAVTRNTRRHRLAAVLGADSPDRQPRLRAQDDRLGAWLQAQSVEGERRGTRSIR